MVHTTILDFPGGSDAKESTCNAGDPDLIPGLGGSPGEGNGNTLQYFCLEKSHRQRSLTGYSPWGCKESDMTEQLTHVCTTVSAEVSWIQGCGTMDTQCVRRADCGYVWWGRAPVPCVVQGSAVLLPPATLLGCAVAWSPSAPASRMPCRLQALEDHLQRWTWGRGVSQSWRPLGCLPALVHRGPKDGIHDSKHLCFWDISKVSPLQITVTMLFLAKDPAVSFSHRGLKLLLIFVFIYLFMAVQPVGS